MSVLLNTINDILELLNNEVSNIKLSLPDGGRRFEVKKYIITQSMFNILLLNPTFKTWVESGHEPNLGGTPIRIGESIEIEYDQHSKRKRRMIIQVLEENIDVGEEVKSK